MTMRHIEEGEADTSTPRIAEAPFGRVITAMVTPFTESQRRIDLNATANLARFLVYTGSDGLVVAGTTGESPTISHAEQHDLFQAVRNAVGPNVPILAGTGSNDPKEAVALTEYVAEEKLADGHLVVSPYYNKPPQSGITDYFGAVAGSTDLPIIMYDIPGRTGRAIAHQTMIDLANNFPNIRGLKDAAGDPAATGRLITDPDLPERFVVYSGDDDKNLILARLGSVGAISVASHWAAKEIGAMYDALNQGDDEKAAAIEEALKGSFKFETSENAPNPLPAKAMLRTILGREAVGYARSPMVIGLEAELALEQQARAVHADLITQFAKVA